MYTCPMHPEVVSDKPGRCPECGMNLIPARSKNKVEHQAHDKHAGHKTSSFLIKFWISFALTVPIFFYSDMAMMVFGLRGPEFPGYRYLMLILGSVVYFYAGGVFLLSAYRELQARLPGMMTLIAIAVTAAYSYSVFSTFTGKMEELLFELSSLITIMLLGHYIEMKSVQGAQGALKELSKLLPDKAEVIKGSATEFVPLSELKGGDVVLVKPGGKIPADGKIIEGNSQINESILTGESRPVDKKAGAEVIAGSINGDGSLKIKVLNIGEKTFLSGVMRLVKEAQNSKSRLQILSDRAAFYLTIIAIAGGSVTFMIWMLIDSEIATAIRRTVAVLVITCPHALGLAVPLVASISTTMAAKNGLLVRERMALEEARNIDTVLFDKTGTLTEGKFQLISVTNDEVLRLAAAVEKESEHPIALAVTKAATKKKIAVPQAKNYRRLPGAGAVAEIEGSSVFVGHKGGDEIVVEKDGTQIGSLVVEDAIRPEAREAINNLRNKNIKIAMITGDSEEVAKRVAGELKIDEYFSRVRPEEKVSKVKKLQGEGRKVAMVGDGVNDAPALTQADVGIAIGAGTNVAIESAGIILVRNDPRDIPKIFNLSRLTYRKMVENLFWATGYNVVAIPLAAGALAWKGIVLEPAIAAILMSASTVIVAVNAIFLKKQKL